MATVVKSAAVDVVYTIAATVDAEEFTIRFSPALPPVAANDAQGAVAARRPRDIGWPVRRGWSIVDFKGWHARLAATRG